MTHFAHSVPAGPHFHQLGGPQGNALLRNAKSALRASIKQKGLGNFRCGNRAHDSDWNIEDVTDTEICAAIRYLEPNTTNASELGQVADKKDNLHCTVSLLLPSSGSTAVDARFWYAHKMRFMSTSWDSASTSVWAAILGSLTGALAFSVSTWITQRHQNRRDMLAKGMSLSTLLTDLPLR